MEEDCDALFEHLSGGYWKFRNGHSKFFKLQGLEGHFSACGIVCQMEMDLFC